MLKSQHCSDFTSGKFCLCSVHIKHGNCRGQKRKRIALEKEIKEAKHLPKRRHVRTAKTTPK